MIVIVALACSLSFMAAVNYYWPPEQRRAHNDLIGWQLSVLGYHLCGHRRVYALHGLDQLWNGGPEYRCGSEFAGECLPPSDGLSPDQGTKLKTLARRMAMRLSTMNGRDGSDVMPRKAVISPRQMWATLMTTKGASPARSPRNDHAGCHELSAWAGYRGIRLVESASRLPTVLWFVLLIGGTVRLRLPACSVLPMAHCT